ncbi:hypothetical protein [Staphylococcus phage APTC_SA_12]|nr:MAG: hypothetical protein [Staphylococcus phage RP2]UPO38694.1 hypothetical protein [Staphylococcus phage vB_SaS_GE1]UWV19907.1 hypothetical protein [Staphylococcus phage APTC_SA_2]UWV20219.1 hypothetical protein [Staphylococcus phage APTC_SA_4]UWV20391.1 hypothetical protein [Staphylococcus phage APTC_SA_12]UWV20729.1 hypothetical protein [Staphylococcus phage APTC_SA_13]WMT38609.1 hypothetical protein [Staphylococcus phage Sp2021]WPH67311.1 hypothetical protein CUBM_gp152c [Staphylococc
MDVCNQTYLHLMCVQVSFVNSIICKLFSLQSVTV